ncbi:hypothetical protein IPA_08445 [Ignicoccus pacificus DSM 13166]|uniref:Uncharacterized protein n=1 Tax=Ignicoccus pacificus DSM 13166 TaxID=940294 RepID=A0A977KBZ0_9CREN|nr:hypothetical protein IPA_08445 [Ignicoccus pacificus DSM 13166]
MNEEEKKYIEQASSILVKKFEENPRLIINEEMFDLLYPDLRKRLRPSRGWWNPLVSPYSALHFYDQLILVLSAYDEEELKEQYGIGLEELRELIEDGMAVVILASLPERYNRRLLDTIFEAQGTLPTILRVTSSLKAFCSGIYKMELCNPEEISSNFKGLDADDVLDVTERISDLAAFGYTEIAQILLNAKDIKNYVPLVRTVHHMLVEPVTDSLATLALYGENEAEFLRALFERASSPQGGSVDLLVSIMANYFRSLGAEAKLWVPKSIKLSVLRKLADDKDLEGAREHMIALRNRLRRAVVRNDPDQVEEAKEIAREAAQIAMDVNRRIESRIGISSKLKTALGLLAQLPFSMMPTDEKGMIINAALSALLPPLVGKLSDKVLDKRLRKLDEKLVLREERVRVVSLVPILLNEKAS